MNKLTYIFISIGLAGSSCTDMGSSQFHPISDFNTPFLQKKIKETIDSKDTFSCTVSSSDLASETKKIDFTDSLLIKNQLSVFEEADINKSENIPFYSSKTVGNTTLIQSDKHTDKKVKKIELQYSNSEISRALIWIENQNRLFTGYKKLEITFSKQGIISWKINIDHSYFSGKTHHYQITSLKD